MNNESLEYTKLMERTAVPERLPNGAEFIDSILSDAGIYGTREMILRLDREMERRAIRRAGEVLRVVAWRLEGTSVGEALLRQLGSGASYRKAAVKAGCSAPAVLKAEKRIKRRLTPPGIPVE